jgi:Nuclease-related domain/HRDC domain
MAFFDTFIEVMTDKPVHLKAPHFYKVDSDARRQLAELTEFSKTCSGEMKLQVERDIKMLTYGIAGEEQVVFELKNCYMPIIIMHDIHIEYEDQTAQIDFVIVTTKFVLFIECKNLVGNIEVTESGDFIRTTEFNGHVKKEGIYSPITQNARHLDLVKKIKSGKKNILLRSIFEKYFDDNYRSVVVLANPKTISNLKKAKKEVKDQIIRCDQLVSYIKKLHADSNVVVSTEKQMYEWADSFLSMHSPNTTNYLKKYDKNIDSSIMDKSTTSEVKVESATVDSRQPVVYVAEARTASVINVKAQSNCIIEDTPIYKALKKYRFETCKSEGVQAYCIFNNAQMEAVISAMPASLTDLKKISGFGDIKCQKYGDAILEIVRANSQ